MKILSIFLLSFAYFYTASANHNHHEKIFISEMFYTKIEPKLFNWTSHDNRDQFQYRVSLEGCPDLPSWIQYMYSAEYHSGFLYGTPPKHLSNKQTRLELVALNRKNYETRKAILTLMIVPKHPASNLIQMKIDNLNWVHMMDPGRVENLKNIFRKDLWTESANDIHIVFMESAIKMGARLPLKPHQHDGVIVHLGSNSAYSVRLLELQDEIKPLYKLSTCNYKRTSVERIFEDAGFKLDWCAFKVIGDEGSHLPSLGSEMSSRKLEQWHGVRREDSPERNYIDETLFSLAVPAFLFAILICILTAVLCFTHETFFRYDEHSEFFFRNIFHICEEYCSPERPNTKSPAVQLVQYSDTTNQPTTTLKSLKDTPNYLIDNLSLRSQSPCNSMYRENSPKCSSMRPKPPPYKPSPIIHKNGMNEDDI